MSLSSQGSSRQDSAIETQLKLALQAHRAGDLIKARALYEAVLLAKQDFPEVLYNLGLIAIAEEKMDEARGYLEKVLDINPGHINALNNLGALLVYEKDFKQAIDFFASVLTIEPQHEEARNNLATCYLQEGLYSKAIEQYLLFLQQKPNDIGALYSYALALLDSGNFSEAIHQFQQVLIFKKDHLDARSNLGIALLKAGQLEEAEHIFAEVLAVEPQHPIVSYLHAAISGKNSPDKPPKAYVRDLFDHYAKHYEQHMVDVLHYQTPNKLRELFDRYINKKELKILDLGCGTGLSGAAFSDVAANIIGVDLSAKMLALAKHKAVYSELIEDDLISVLKKYKNQFDLLLASDTFNYFGDFDELFKACYQALNNNGYLLFSIEQEQANKNWVLHQNSRYAHSEKYVRDLAEQSDFNVIVIEKMTLRIQNNQPCEGLLCLLNKSEPRPQGSG